MEIRCECGSSEFLVLETVTHMEVSGQIIGTLGRELGQRICAFCKKSDQPDKELAEISSAIHVVKGMA